MKNYGKKTTGHPLFPEKLTSDRIEVKVPQIEDVVPGWSKPMNFRDAFLIETSPFRSRDIAPWRPWKTYPQLRKTQKIVEPKIWNKGIREDMASEDKTKWPFNYRNESRGRLIASQKRIPFCGQFIFDLLKNFNPAWLPDEREDLDISNHKLFNTWLSRLFVQREQSRWVPVETLSDSQLIVTYLDLRNQYRTTNILLGKAKADFFIFRLYQRQVDACKTEIGNRDGLSVAVIEKMPSKEIKRHAKIYDKDPIPIPEVQIREQMFQMGPYPETLVTNQYESSQELTKILISVTNEHSDVFLPFYNENNLRIFMINHFLTAFDMFNRQSRFTIHPTSFIDEVSDEMGRKVFHTYTENPLLDSLKIAGFGPVPDSRTVRIKLIEGEYYLRFFNSFKRESELWGALKKEIPPILQESSGGVSPAFFQEKLGEVEAEDIWLDPDVLEGPGFYGGIPSPQMYGEEEELEEEEGPELGVPEKDPAFPPTPESGQLIERRVELGPTRRFPQVETQSFDTNLIIAPIVLGLMFWAASSQL